MKAELQELVGRLDRVSRKYSLLTVQLLQTPTPKWTSGSAIRYNLSLIREF